MRKRALESVQNTMDCVVNYANSKGFEGPKLDEFAQQFSFLSWEDLERYVLNTCILKSRSLIQFKRVLSTSVEKAWRQISTPELSASWAIEVDFERKEGSDFQFIVPDWKGKIGVFRENEEIRFNAIAGGWTSYRLSVEDGRTVFCLLDYLPPDLEVPEDVKQYTNPNASHQVGGLGTHWPGVLAGWHQGVETLSGLFANTHRDYEYEGATNLYHLLVSDYHQQT